MALLRKLGIKRKLNKEDCFIILLIMVWIRLIIVSYIYQAVLLIPHLSNFANVLKIGIYILVITLSLPFILKKIKFRDVIFGLFICIIFVVNISVYPQTAEYLTKNADLFAIAFFSFYVGLVMENDKCISVLYSWSQLCMVAIIIHFIVFGLQSEVANGAGENMGLAYRILPHFCLIAMYALNEKKVWDIVLSMVGGILLVACGARGALLCGILFLVFYGIFISSPKSKWLLFPVIGGVVIFIYSNLSFCVKILGSVMNSMGYSTRILDAVLTGVLFDDNGRSEIKQFMFDLALKKPWIGYGIAGDRGWSSWMTYSHSIWLELFVSYGFIIGTMILIIISVLLISAFVYSNKHEKAFLLVMIFGGGFFKLFLSSSYLLEFQFFMLMGYCLCLIRKYRKRKFLKIHRKKECNC